jgi:phosphopantothenoylcysteine synthetase/decarboxylase
MRIVITSGPSYEPLDKVRRLSNFSTGELGTLLSEGFAEAGHSVVCFRGVASTFATPLWPVEVIPFTTNDDLAAGLQRLPAREDVSLVLHAAALCDFRVREIVDEAGAPVQSEKMSSRSGALTLTLEPVPKLIASLRRMFPSSILVGGKFVLNGEAYGSGFGVISRTGEQAHLPDRPALCRFLIDWAERTPMALTAPRQESFHALSSFTALSPFI